MALTVVTNASPLIHLGYMDMLEVLPKIYSRIYCSRAVATQVEYPKAAADFVKGLEIFEVKDRGLVELIRAKHPRLDIGEIETFVLHKELNTDEALFLNNRAENIFTSEYRGIIRDLVDLPNADTAPLMFLSQEHIDRFYIKLAEVVKGYKKLEKILRERGLR